ncbi:hypothetical protein FBY10_10193 [Pseudomonas sp. SJZ103]|uniref:hypothetical protein n=1 Tax=unclassified Pseudomonas TaxID=196821 RepID=UPI0011A6C733|nr:MULTISPECIES: hypothetical protein [unclassified Pseudomonas]TWC74403.1 hypothetical protein FBY10_10193 [Pseudomonas sp. SJZ103]TWC93468.1 hypothetical protein FBY08_101965 [Pseudomonas sp. SJZ094]
MTLTRYRYTGPQSCASLRVGESRELLEVQLLPGQQVELPDDHEYTLVLLELKHLVLLPTTSAEKKGAKANAS